MKLLQAPGAHASFWHLRDVSPIAHAAFLRKTHLKNGTLCGDAVMALFSGSTREVLRPFSATRGSNKLLSLPDNP